MCCVIYHVMESKYHSDDKCAARVINFVVLLKLLSSVGGIYHLYLACSGEIRAGGKGSD